MKLGDLFEPSGADRVGYGNNIPVMSITMHSGLIDQKDKFNKRIASKDISKYRKVYRNELVVGFPIDEGVLGFQTKYKYAAVSPAYKIWKLKKSTIDIRVLEMILRSNTMREIYKLKLQGAVDRRRSIPDEIFLEIEIPQPSKNMILEIAKRYEEMIRTKQRLAGKNNDLKNAVERLWKQRKK